MHFFLEIIYFISLGNPDGPFFLSDDACHCSGDTGSLQAEEMEGCGWLKEIEKPESFAVVGAMYRGPQIVEN